MQPPLERAVTDGTFVGGASVRYSKSAGLPETKLCNK